MEMPTSHDPRVSARQMLATRVNDSSETEIKKVALPEVFLAKALSSELS